MTQLKIKTNVVYKHLVENQKKIVVEQGGTRSGKTYNIILWIIFEYCTRNNNKIITICRKTFPSLRATVLRDFMSILQANNIYSEHFHNKSNSEYHLFGNLVEFISLDQPQKIRGRKRDLLFVNEANELYFEDWQQLLFRTQDKIIIDFNPSDEYHWIYDRVIPREDCAFFKTTYLDNPFVEDSIIKEIEANLIAYGMDFGYTNDPTTFVSVYTEGYNLYVKEHLYRTQMTTQDINVFLREQNLSGNPIYADSAEPRLISELRRMGHNILPSIKGRDSVNAGIDLLKRYKIHILSSSTNAISEFRAYKWREDKSGMLVNIPEDKHNHIIDPCRYATYSILSRPNFGKYALH